MNASAFKEVQSIPRGIEVVCSAPGHAEGDPAGAMIMEELKARKAEGSGTCSALESTVPLTTSTMPLAEHVAFAQDRNPSITPRRYWQ